MKQDSTNLSKNEAIQALDKGHKLTHTYFDAGEWIAAHKVGTQTYVTEQGYTVSREQFWNDRQGEKWETGWSILNEGDSTKTPLWRGLNERRTAGKWEVEKYPAVGYPNVIKSEFTSSHVALMGLPTEGDDNTVEAKANAQYTALAVNHFASLAEALEELNNAATGDAFDSDKNTKRLMIAKQKAKEALAAIS